MKTKPYTFYDEKGIEVIIIAPVDIHFPSFKMEYYKTITRCGAGKGWGDKAVPETNWGLRMTLACFVHDDMFEESEATWKDFHHSNSVFLRNINAIIKAFSVRNTMNVLKHLRMYRAVTAYNIVDGAGALVFWNLKSGDGTLILEESHA